jgi:hypothetical protein
MRDVPIKQRRFLPAFWQTDSIYGGARVGVVRVLEAWMLLHERSVMLVVTYLDKKSPIGFFQILLIVLRVSHKAVNFTAFYFDEDKLYFLR